MRPLRHGPSGMTAHSLTVRALIPVKPLSVCKRRLASVLGNEERQALGLWMLHHLLHVLAASPSQRPLVLSDDATVRSLCQRHATEWAPDPGADLNDTLDRAAASAFAKGWPAILFLPADLPLVTAEDVEDLLARYAEGGPVILAPAVRDGGTNAVLFGASSGFRFQMGHGSFARHGEQAERLGLRWQACESPGLAFDLDTPEDLQQVTLPAHLVEWYGRQRVLPDADRGGQWHLEGAAGEAISPSLPRKAWGTGTFPLLTKEGLGEVPS